MFHLLFIGTTEDVIDIGDLDYEWQLDDASEKLEKFVKSFKLYKIGLNDDVTSNVCSEANLELYQCIESESHGNVEEFYLECLQYINDIFQKGSQDLITRLGNVTITICLNLKHLYENPIIQGDSSEFA